MFKRLQKQLRKWAELQPYPNTYVYRYMRRVRWDRAVIRWYLIKWFIPQSYYPSMEIHGRRDNESYSARTFTVLNKKKT